MLGNFRCFSFECCIRIPQIHLEMLSRYYGMLLPQDCGQMSDADVRRWMDVQWAVIVLSVGALRSSVPLFAM